MPDGKALQAATSHELGQNFSRAYGIKFSAEDQTEQFAWTTSWGMSWRMLGALIMVHGDDRGLRFPPRMAPVEAVVVPIPKGDSTDVLAAARDLYDALRKAGVRVKLDDRDGLRPGAKFADWEMRGVPLRIELGANDLAAGVATLVRRDREKGADGAEDDGPDRRRAGAHRAADGRDPAVALRTGAGVFALAHATGDRPRRVLPPVPRARGHDRHPVVRARRVRGARQGRDERDDAQPASARRAGRGLRRLRRTGPRARVLRAVRIERARARCAPWGARIGHAAHGRPLDLNAEARAAGNRRPEAVQIGRVLLARTWPAQVPRFASTARDRTRWPGSSSPASSSTARSMRRGFTAEVAQLVRRTFAAARRRGGRHVDDRAPRRGPRPGRRRRFRDAHVPHRFLGHRPPPTASPTSSGACGRGTASTGPPTGRPRSVPRAGASGAEGAGPGQPNSARLRPLPETGLYRKTTLPNGVRIITETMPHVRSASLGIWADVGSAAERREQRGVSHLVEHMLFKGTERRTRARDRRGDGRRRRQPQRVHR